MSKKSETIFGLHAAQAVIEQDPLRVLEAWVQDERLDQRMQSLVQALEQQGLKVQRVGRKTLDRLSEEGRHQGIVLRCRPLQSLDEGDLPGLLSEAKQPLVLVLDGVQDPHNLGACLRSADAAGVTAVIIPKDRAGGITPTVRKVACGAAENVPVLQVTNLVRCLQQLQELGFWMVGLAGEAETNYYSVDLKGPTALVLGAEEKGLRRLTRENCDVLAYLPMAGSVESLNVSVATGICLFEAVRQRQA